MKEPSELTYTQAITELEEILKKMQAENSDIDSLAQLTRRATHLIAECKSRLVATDAELKEILGSVSNE